MLLDHPRHFKTGVRVFTLVFRNKDGNSHKPFIKTSYHEDSFDDTIQKLINIEKEIGLKGRIYSSVEPRCLKKAAREFKRRQLDADYNEDYLFYTRLNNTLKSCLMHPSSSLEKYWLFDCDSIEDYAIVSSVINKFYNREFKPYEYKTKSGTHIVTQPFNMNNKISKNILHKNGMMLWYYNEE